MTIPPYLHKDDKIAITCPSGFLPIEKTTLAINTLSDWGYEVVLGKTVGKQHNYFSGNDQERLQDLQNFLDDPNIAAILMGRGGYGLSRIIDQLDFTQFIKHPKWICGFSDITVLHSHIQKNFGIATLHSPMCGAFKEDTVQAEHILSLQKSLQGKNIHYPIIHHFQNRNGKVTGELVGGNLAILTHLTGSVSQLDTKGKILFIEDVGEYLYNIDRMLLNLKRAGMFDHIIGLVCGGFTDLQDTTVPFGQTIIEIIWDKVKEYDFPVCFGFPTGHCDVNYTLHLGAAHTLQIDDKKASLINVEL